MSTLDDLRSLWDEHATEDLAMTLDCEVVLRKHLLGDRARLYQEKVRRQAHSAGSLAEGGVDVSDIDAELTELQVEIDAATMTLHFHALLEPEYRRIARKHPNANPQDPGAQDDFLAELADKCLTGVTFRGSRVDVADLKPGEWRAKLSPADFDEVTQQVWTLNKAPQNLQVRPK